MSNLDDIANENDKQKVFQGTAAEMVEGQDWFIQLPNGKYDVKVTLKIVDNTVNKSKFTGRTPMDFMLNEIAITTSPLSIKDEIIHDKPNVNVTNGEIRLKWVKGTVSILSVQIIPQAEAADAGAVRKEISTNTFMGGDCMKGNSKNCVFDENQLTAIKCDGVMVKIGSKAQNKAIACMYKCVDSTFDSMEDCNKFVPETLRCAKKNTK